MPGYGTLSAARNLRPDTLGAVTLTAAVDPSSLQLTPLLHDPSDSEGEYCDPSDLERGVYSLEDMEIATPCLTTVRDLSHLAAMLVAIPMVYFTLVGVSVAVGYCLGYSAWEVFRVMVLVGIVLTLLFCGIPCSQLWDETDVGNAVKEALVLFVKTLGAELVLGVCVYGAVVLAGRGVTAAVAF